LSIQDFLKQKLARKSLFDFGIFYGSFFFKKKHIGIILEILIKMITKNG